MDAWNVTPGGMTCFIRPSGLILCSSIRTTGSRCHRSLSVESARPSTSPGKRFRRFGKRATHCSSTSTFGAKHVTHFARRLVSELRERTGAGFTEAFLTPHVLFLLATQDRHLERLSRVAEVLSARWGGQIDTMGLANKPLE